jgi:hypothetical protein
MKLTSVIAATKSSLIALVAGTALFAAGVAMTGHGAHTSLSADGTTATVAAPAASASAATDPTPW